ALRELRIPCGIRSVADEPFDNLVRQLLTHSHSLSPWSAMVSFLNPCPDDPQHTIPCPPPPLFLAARLGSFKVMEALAAFRTDGSEEPDRPRSEFRSNCQLQCTDVIAILWQLFVPLVRLSNAVNRATGFGMSRPPDSATIQIPHRIVHSK